MKKTIYEHSRVRAYALPESLTGFVAWAQAQLDAIPPEHRATATIEFESEYESSGCDVEIRWNRPETDEEQAAREAKEANEAAFKVLEQERRELELFAKLQAKYGQSH